MGLTFLAAGTSVPEAVASVIVTNQGMGQTILCFSVIFLQFNRIFAQYLFFHPLMQDMVPWV